MSTHGGKLSPFPPGGATALEVCFRFLKPKTYVFKPNYTALLGTRRQNFRVRTSLAGYANCFIDTLWLRSCIYGHRPFLLKIVISGVFLKFKVYKAFLVSY